MTLASTTIQVLYPSVHPMGNSYRQDLLAGQEWYALALMQSNLP